MDIVRGPMARGNKILCADEWDSQVLPEIKEGKSEDIWWTARGRQVWGVEGKIMTWEK